MQISPQLPDNIEELKALLSAQFAMVQALEDERTNVQIEFNSIKTERDLLKAGKRDDSDEINRLKLLISKLQRTLFGQKSEKLERQIDQLELELEDLYINQGERAQIIEQAQANLPKAARTPRAPRQPLPKHCRVKCKKYCPLKPIAQAAVVTLCAWVKMSAKC
jgi:chromosome segregation ATPase